MQDNAKIQFQSMYERFQGMLRIIAYNKHVLAQDIDDLIQETFIIYLQRYPLDWNDQQKKSMLAKILVSKIVDRHRRQKGRRSISLDDDEYGDTMEIRLHGDYEGPLQKILNKELAHNIKNCIENMKETKLKEIIMLHIIEEIPFGEVCKMMDINETAGRMQLHRAREYIRKYLEKTNGEPISLRKRQRLNRNQSEK